MNLLKPKLKLVKGTRFVSFLFIGCSILIAAGILFAANMYYNIDTSEIVMEEIQRTTGLIRAVGGAIIGGTSTSTLAADVAFQVASSSAVLLSGSGQELRFSGADPSGYYTGFKATTTLTTTTVYIWPGTYPATTSYYLTANPSTGEMSWSVPTGAGDIQAVGNVENGRAFTSDLGTTYGTTLWFHPNATYTGALTIDPSLGANATYTLPAISGTNYLTLASGNLGSGGVLFADGGLISTSTYFTWSTSSRALSLGSAGNAGELRIYSSGGDYYLGFAADPSATTTSYTWPADFGTNNYVLTTDGSGGLDWKSASGTGAVVTQGSPQAGWVTYFVDSSTLTGTSTFTWSTSTQKLTLGGGLVANLIEYTNGDLELRTNTSGDIFLNPASNIVQLATSTYIRTHGGYKIGATGTQILVEMIPILGFDLPVQTATTSYVKISKDLENYPFQSAATGTTRVHKLVFRYAASSTNLIDWRISTSTGQTYSSSTLATTTSNDLAKGNAYVTTTTIPTDGTDWWLDIKTNTASDVVRVFQIFLAAYDQIN